MNSTFNSKMMVEKLNNMSIVDKVDSEIKKAMLAKDKDRLAALRGMKSALAVQATAKKGGGEVSDETAIKVLNTLLKQRVESATIFREQDREALAVVEEFQAEVIKDYLPKQMDEVEVTEKIKEIISEVGAESQRDMGKVMGAFNAKYAGEAPGKLVSEIVKKELT